MALRFFDDDAWIGAGMGRVRGLQTFVPQLRKVVGINVGERGARSVTLSLVRHAASDANSFVMFGGCHVCMILSGQSPDANHAPEGLKKALGLSTGSSIFLQPSELSRKG